MKGKVLLEIRIDSPDGPDEVSADCSVDSLSGSGAALLIWKLCDVLKLSYEYRGAILHLIASGSLDPLNGQVRRGVS